MATTKATEKVTNLGIKRSGNNSFTAEWTNHGNYGWMAVHWRVKVNGSWHDWHKYDSQSSFSKYKLSGLNLANYYPYNNNVLSAIQVKVYSKYANTSKITYEKAEQNLYWNFYVPPVPSVSAIAGATGTTFSYSVGVTDKDQYGFQGIYYSTYQGSSWSEETFLSSASGSFSCSGIGTQNIGNNSIEVVGRARAAGSAGTSGYTYASVIYAKPLQAKNLALYSMTAVSSGYDCVLTWDKNVDSAHPANEHKVEYYIGTPANTSLACPSGVTWTEVGDYEPDVDGTAQSSSFHITGIEGEQCMWVRVKQRWLGALESISDNKLFRAPTSVIAPTIDSVTYNAATRSITVSFTKNSTLNASTTVSANGTKLTVSGTSATGTVNLNALASGKYYDIVALNTFGAYSSRKTTVTFNPAHDHGVCTVTNPTRFYPTNVDAVQTSNAIGVRVTWNNVMLDVSEAEVAWATSLGAWSDTPTYTSVTISGTNVKTATITNDIEFETRYYFKVKTTNNSGSSGWSTAYDSLILSAENAPSPVIDAVEEVDAEGQHYIVVRWAWSVERADAIELLYSTNEKAVNNANASWTKVDRSGRQGEYWIAVTNEQRKNVKWHVWGRFVINNGRTKPKYDWITLTVTPQTPTGATITRVADAADSISLKTKARLDWTHNWADSLKTIVSWDTDPSAWSTTKGASNSAELGGQEKQAIIPDLDLGKEWYARVRIAFDDEAGYYGETNNLYLDLRTAPYTPSVSVSKTVVSNIGILDVSWTYGNEDASAQASAIVSIYDSEQAKLIEIPVIGNETALSISPQDRGLTGDNDYYVTVQTNSENGKSSALSEYIPFTVINKPIASIASTSLVDVVIDEGEETEHTVKALQSMPLAITISGVQTGCSAYVYIERTNARFLDKPDESEPTGFVGELIVKAENDSGVFTISQSDLRTNFEQNGDYKITAFVVNNVGVSSDQVTLDFTCLWTDHAVMPTATCVVDGNIVKITPTAGQGTPQDSYFEIYRLSADKPELIYQGAEWGVTYVDPYPALGEYGGHRIVCRTSTGDYTTADGSLAWLDIETDPPIPSDTALVDFSGSQIDFIYNVDVSHSWDKDFTETQYLGGSVQGDWNPAVSRKSSISTVMITLIDSDKIETMRRLANYTGLCHVRTPDGSSFAADVQVSETWNHDRGHKVVEFSMDITRVDSEGFDMMALTDWEAS